MKLKNKKPKIKIFVRFLLSYILIMLIPFILSIAAYREVIFNAEENAKEMSLMSLNNCKSLLDSNFEQIESLTMQLASNPKVISFLNESSPYVDRTLPSKINDLREEFMPYNGYVEPNSFISSIGIYFNASDITISTNVSNLTLTRYYGNFFIYNNMSLEQWTNNIVNARHYKEFFPEATVMQSKNANDYWIESKMLMYMQSLSLESMNKGYIMILLSVGKIENLLKDIAMNKGGWAYITDSQNRIMTTFSMPNSEKNYFEPDKHNLEGFIDIVEDGQELLVIYTTSTQNGWRYVAVLPKTSVLEKAYHVKIFIIKIIIITILAGILGAIFLAYKNHKPIKKIIKLIKSMMGAEDKDVNIDEYTFINSSLAHLAENDQDMKDRLRRQLPLLKSTFVERLLESDIEDLDEILWLGDQLNFNKLQGCIAVVIACLVHNTAKGSNKLNDVSAAKLLLVDTLEEILESDVYYYDLDFERRALIFGIGEGRENAKDYINSSLLETNRILEGKHGITIIFAVGSLGIDYPSINKSFEEAKEVIGYMTMSSCGKITWADDLPHDGSSYYYPLECETKLISYAKLGNYKNVEHILQRVYKENFEKRKLSASSIRMLIADMCGTILKFLDTLSTANMETVREIKSSTLPAIEQCAVIDNAFAMIQITYDHICNLFANNKRRSDIKEKISNYIMANYTNPQFCLTALADAFNFAPAYLSQLFKDITGENFKDLIERIRVEKACDLIKKGMSMQDVAQNVGYNSIQVLRGAFKRVMGLSPSKFKCDGKTG
jgi:two-component system, response regulator YesN